MFTSTHLEETDHVTVNCEYYNHMHSVFMHCTNVLYFHHRTVNTYTFALFIESTDMFNCCRSARMNMSASFGSWRPVLNSCVTSVVTMSQSSAWHLPYYYAYVSLSYPPSSFVVRLRINLCCLPPRDSRRRSCSRRALLSVAESNLFMALLFGYACWRFTWSPCICPGVWSVSQWNSVYIIGSGN